MDILILVPGTLKINLRGRNVIGRSTIWPQQ